MKNPFFIYLKFGSKLKLAELTIQYKIEVTFYRLFQQK